MKIKFLNLLLILILIFSISFSLAELSTEQTTQADSYYNGLIKPGISSDSPSSLTDEQLAHIVDTKSMDKGFEQFVNNMNKEDFYRAFGTEKGLEKVSPSNTAVWGRLKTEMANKGNWMNKDENRPLFNKFLSESGLQLPDNFNSGVTAENGFVSRVEMLQYDDKSGVAELRYKDSIFGGKTTKVNLGEIKSFGGVSMAEDGTLGYSGAKLGYGEFKFISSGTKSIEVIQKSGDMNVDLSSYTGNEAVTLKNAKGTGGVVLPNGAKFRDTEYTVSKSGNNLLANAGQKQVEIFNPDGKMVAGVTQGSVSYDSTGKKFDFSKVNAQTGGVAIYDYTRDTFLNNPDVYGVVRYGGEWSLAQDLKPTDIQVNSLTKPLVVMNDRDTGLFDIGEGNARTLDVYNQGTTTFAVTDVARDSYVNAVRKSMSETGDVLVTTQDGLNVNLWNDGSVSLTASGDAKQQKKIAGTFRGFATSQSSDGKTTGAVKFEDKLINVPWLRDDRVELGVVSGGNFDSNGIGWDATSINTDVNPTQATDTTTVTKSKPETLRRNKVTQASAQAYAQNIEYKSKQQGADISNILKEIEQLAGLFGSFGKTEAETQCGKLSQENCKDPCEWEENACKLKSS